MRRSNVPIGQLQAPKAKTTTARMDASAPPPAMLGAVNLSDGGAAERPVRLPNRLGRPLRPPSAASCNSRN